MSNSTLTPSISELENFQWFVEHRLVAHGKSGLSLDQAVEAYRQYRSDLQRLQREIQPAIDSLERGDGKEIDFEELRERLAKRVREADTIEKCRSS